MQSSPHTLWLPKLYYFHFSWHPRSPVHDVSEREHIGHYGHYGHSMRNDGSVPVHPWVRAPDVLYRTDGPSNPTLSAWGLGEFVAQSLPTVALQGPQETAPQRSVDSPGPSRTRVRR